MGGYLELWWVMASLSEDKSLQMFREQPDSGPTELRGISRSTAQVDERQKKDKKLYMKILAFAEKKASVILPACWNILFFFFSVL